MMKKVELLAPAGNYESFLGAINAGADAVYLGGERFGARAFAGNFTNEQVCRAIEYAHLWGRKVYLTVNTLMKEREAGQLYEYLLPFYETGLDAVIVQDMGAFTLIRESFPGMELHVSTQMTITGSYGAELMKELGASRIVPARELSLEEIKNIKKEVPIEIEAFVHGAMCYCYSGQCLFSSILGGRSGNRGRCAQPCRLPYRVQMGQGSTPEEYPLSLKDMCTIEILPELIEAGIDSFKIEGRMKKPEYVAGVTAVYRNYIDRYYEARQKGTPERFSVDAADLDRLGQLYIRSERQDGYYHKHNGREMVTIKSPGYSGTQEALLQEIREKYLTGAKTQELKAVLYCHVGEPLLMTLECRGVSVTVTGENVQEAQNAPATEEETGKRLSKLGNTDFTMAGCEIMMEGNCFLPVKSLNELRRQGIAALTEALLQGTGRNRTARLQSPGSLDSEYRCQEKDKEIPPQLSCEVTTKGQYLALKDFEGIDRLYVPGECLKGEGCLEQLAAAKKKQIFLALPFILRKRDKNELKELRQVLGHPAIDGVLFRNLEQLEWLSQIGCRKERIADAGLYVWNRGTAAFYALRGIAATAPYELNQSELRAIRDSFDEMVVYGRLPMMISANCIYKTHGKCSMDGSCRDRNGKNGNGAWSLKDRKGKEFEVHADCAHCYNIIYNSLPMSLYNQIGLLRQWQLSHVRLSFTMEEAKETAQIAAYFRDALRGTDGGRALPFQEYTNGHFKRGVE